MTERKLFTLKEVKDTFFPNVTMEQLEGELTDDEIRKRLNRIVEKSQEVKINENVTSKKLPK